MTAASYTLFDMRRQRALFPASIVLFAVACHSSDEATGAATDASAASSTSGSGGSHAASTSSSAASTGSAQGGSGGGSGGAGGAIDPCAGRLLCDDFEVYA